MFQDILDYFNIHSDDIIGGLVLVAVVLGLYLVASRCLVHLREKGKLAGGLVHVLQRFMRWGVFIVAILLMLQSFDLLQNAWTTLTAVLGLIAIGFVAVWSVLSNTLCSIILLINRPFEVGDIVEIPSDNIAGKVVNFDMIFTRLQDESGKYVQVPNNLFFQRAIKRQHGESTVTLEEQLERVEDTV